MKLTVKFKVPAVTLLLRGKKEKQKNSAKNSVVLGLAGKAGFFRKF